MLLKVPVPGLNAILHLIWGAKYSQLFPGLAEEPFCIENPQVTKEWLLQLVAAKAEKQNKVGDSRMMKGKGTVFCSKMAKPRGFSWPLPCPVPQLKSVFRKKCTYEIWNSHWRLFLSVLSFSRVCCNSQVLAGACPAHCSKCALCATCWVPTLVLFTHTNRCIWTVKTASSSSFPFFVQADNGLWKFILMPPRQNCNLIYKLIILPSKSPLSLHVYYLIAHLYAYQLLTALKEYKWTFACTADQERESGIQLLPSFPSHRERADFGFQWTCLPTF